MTAAIVCLGVVLVGLVVWATWDLMYRPAEEWPSSDWEQAYDSFVEVWGREPTVQELIDLVIEDERWVLVEVEVDDE